MGPPSPSACRLPAGYTLLWTGQYEFQVRARDRFKVLIPLVVFIIFMLLYLTFHSASEATIVMLSVVSPSIVKERIPFPGCFEPTQPSCPGEKPV